MISEFIDFLKFESRFGLRVFIIDLIAINKLYFRKIYLDKLLNLAAKDNLKFTFFVRSYNLKNKKYLIKNLKKGGHEIASHGHSHVLYNNKSKFWIQNELKKSQKEFKKMDINVKGFRSPFLSENKLLYDVLDELKFTYSSNRFKKNKIKTKIKQAYMIYPSDWHGLIVENWSIEKIIKSWKDQKGTLALHPWIFVKHYNKLKSIIGSQKDLTIINNLKKENLKISFDVY
ncbi:polysaccharide deacetylase family protein [archaeon]|jgi:peptidoglycan/xylan/chitin deacetylase (PgdA/CDA1 family)|nr:polysaccharide deacetylase family protein [Candidatus Woesearchaeota archaeon]MBT3720196.1 polysaccharide deacetylase family protein [archaeon]MBT4022633.1 polysaccharide deacetylase family protein [archaeon]MBT4272073.1 polysaccharide deacetylase family protein [archaeon]MBT4461170.1 polysaccharide deacetylase family protein [archaeon]